MVKIRLARAGSKKRAFYHIVVADKQFRSRRSGTCNRSNYDSLN